jgi:hypothetical protein
MTDLSDKMRALADTGHPDADDLIEKANALDEAFAAFYGVEQAIPAKSYLGAWARARKAWSNASGEPLL